MDGSIVGSYALGLALSFGCAVAKSADFDLAKDERFCQIALGGADRASDGAPHWYGEQLLAAIKAIGGDESDAIAKVRADCAAAVTKEAQQKNPG